MSVMATELHDWLIELGGVVDGIAVGRDPELSIAGVVSTRRLCRENEQILRVPVGCLIVDALCQRCTAVGRAIAPLESKLHAAHIVQLVAFALMEGYEECRGGSAELSASFDGFYGPFWRSLPADDTLANYPVLWPAEQLEWLRGSTAALEAAKLRQEIREDYDRVCEAAPSLCAFTFERFLRCHTLLGSRCFGVAVSCERSAAIQSRWHAQHGGPPAPAPSPAARGAESSRSAESESESESSSEEEEEGGGARRRRIALPRGQRRRRHSRAEEWTVLAPFADMLNHESGGGSVEWDMCDDTDAEASAKEECGGQQLGDMVLTVVKKGTIEAGGAVYTYYGDYSNSELLVQYGFAVAGSEQLSASASHSLPLPIRVDLAAAGGADDGGTLLRRRRTLLTNLPTRGTLVAIGARLSCCRSAQGMRRTLGLLRVACASAAELDRLPASVEWDDAFDAGDCDLLLSAASEQRCLDIIAVHAKAAAHEMQRGVGAIAAARRGDDDGDESADASCRRCNLRSASLVLKGELATCQFFINLAAVTAPLLALEPAQRIAAVITEHKPLLETSAVSRFIVATSGALASGGV